MRTKTIDELIEQGGRLLSRLDCNNELEETRYDRVLHYILGVSQRAVDRLEDAISSIAPEYQDAFRAEFRAMRLTRAEYEPIK